MFRIRFHGRGGQGMKTASRILGSAFFHAGYEVQDAPHYGAERRGAPVSARACRARHEAQRMRPPCSVVHSRQKKCPHAGQRADASRCG